MSPGRSYPVRTGEDPTGSCDRNDRSRRRNLCPIRKTTRSLTLNHGRKQETR